GFYTAAVSILPEKTPAFRDRLFHDLVEIAPDKDNDRAVRRLDAIKRALAALAARPESGTLEEWDAGLKTVMEQIEASLALGVPVPRHAADAKFFEVFAELALRGTPDERREMFETRLLPELSENLDTLQWLKVFLTLESLIPNLERELALKIPAALLATLRRPRGHLIASQGELRRKAGDVIALAMLKAASWDSKEELWMVVPLTGILYRLLDPEKIPAESLLPEIFLHEALQILGLSSEPSKASAKIQELADGLFQTLDRKDREDSNLEPLDPDGIWFFPHSELRAGLQPEMKSLLFETVWTPEFEIPRAVQDKIRELVPAPLLKELGHPSGKPLPVLPFGAEKEALGWALVVHAEGDHKIIVYLVREMSEVRWRQFSSDDSVKLMAEIPLTLDGPTLIIDFPGRVEPFRQALKLNPDLNEGERTFVWWTQHQLAPWASSLGIRQLEI
ncbi:MAG: hypothetical protein COW13_05285, partial [Candidatus Omnitrophica bacterium CG12_big_fil_rev_8_21_14_0_65_50_5]